MGKYFNGKQPNYKRTGKKQISRDGLKKIILDSSRGGKSAPAYYAHIFLVRSRKILVMVSVGIVGTCRKLANGVKVLSIRVFTAIANLAEKSIRFLDDV